MTHISSLYRFRTQQVMAHFLAVLTWRIVSAFLPSTLSSVFPRDAKTASRYAILSYASTKSAPSSYVLDLIVACVNLEPASLYFCHPSADSSVWNRQQVLSVQSFALEGRNKKQCKQDVALPPVIFCCFITPFASPLVGLIIVSSNIFNHLR